MAARRDPRAASPDLHGGSSGSSMAFLYAGLQAGASRLAVVPESTGIHRASPGSIRRGRAAGDVIPMARRRRGEQAGLPHLPRGSRFPGLTGRTSAVQAIAALASQRQHFAVARAAVSPSNGSPPSSCDGAAGNATSPATGGEMLAIAQNHGSCTSTGDRQMAETSEGLQELVVAVGSHGT